MLYSIFNYFKNINNNNIFTRYKNLFLQAELELFFLSVQQYFKKIIRFWVKLIDVLITNEFLRNMSYINFCNAKINI